MFILRGPGWFSSGLAAVGIVRPFDRLGSQAWSRIWGAFSQCARRRYWLRVVQVGSAVTFRIRLFERRFEYDDTLEVAYLSCLVALMPVALDSTSGRITYLAWRVCQRYRRWQPRATGGRRLGLGPLAEPGIMGAVPDTPRHRWR